MVIFKLIGRSFKNAKRIGHIIMDMQNHIPQLFHLKAGIDLLSSERSLDIVLIVNMIP